jgi:hypothetical protein
LGRRSRKRRPVAATAGEPPARPTRAARSEERNAAARAQLKPLAPGERPRAVTVAAIIAALLAIANLVGAFIGVGLNGKSVNAVSVALWPVVLVIAAVGMWRAKYWAVLGFQAALAFQILIFALLLLKANLLGAVILIPIIAALGYLFWKLVRAMARLQMPDRQRPT